MNPRQKMNFFQDGVRGAVVVLTTTSENSVLQSRRVDVAVLQSRSHYIDYIDNWKTGVWNLQQIRRDQM